MFWAPQGEVGLPNQELMLLHNTLLKLQLEDCLQFKRKMKAWTEQRRAIRLIEWMKSPPRGSWTCLICPYVNGEVGLVYIIGFILVAGERGGERSCYSNCYSKTISIN